MTIGTWVILTGLCLLYVGLGLWAVSHIFPGDRATRLNNPDQQQKGQAMNTNMQGHNHGGKSHLLWMLGIGGGVLVVQLGIGRSFAQSLPLAFFVACPLMMIGMMFMMGGGNGHRHGNDADDRPDHNDGTNRRGNDAPAPWQDSPNMTPARPQDKAGPDGPRRARG